MSGLVRIAVSQESFTAIKRTLPQDRELAPIERTSTGRVFIWLPKPVVDRLSHVRERGEDHSDVIIRLAQNEE